MRERRGVSSQEQLPRNEVVSELYEKFYKSLVNYAYSVTRNRDVATDLVQGVFTHILETNVEIPEPDRAAFSYLKVAVRNACFLQYRTQARQPNTVSYDGVGTGEDAQPMDILPQFGRPPTQDADLLKRELHTAVQGLASIYQETMLLYLAGNSASEIAQQLGVPETTVWTRIHRAIKQLEDRMGKSV